MFFFYVIMNQCTIIPVGIIVSMNNIIISINTYS